ncbi:interphotoreceptor matrix proteoglycan 2-like [Eucyclogobius newberryi]|uniref:interphotoreceptor matrix proteoglycan 2-like n=1 Tax=Eucyclogobius newberryi TaxID=166745 RepID=UPI003B5AAB5F
MDASTKSSLEDKEPPSQAEETRDSTEFVSEEEVVLVPRKDEEIVIESPSLEEELNQDVETVQEDVIDKDEEKEVEMMFIDESKEEEPPLMPPQDETLQENIDLEEDILRPILAGTEATDIQQVNPDFETVEDRKLVEMMTKPTQGEVEELETVTPTVWVISDELPQEAGEVTVEIGTTKVELEFTKAEPLEISPTAEVSPTSEQSERPEQDSGVTEAPWTEKLSTTAEVWADFETEVKVPDQEVDLKEKNEEKVPDQEVDLKEKTEEKVPDQEVDLKEKTEEKVPDQEMDLKEKTEEKVPDQEVDLKEKNEEKVPDQEVDLKQKNEEKVPDQDVDLKEKTEEKVPDQEVDLKEKNEEKVPDQDVDLKEKTEEKVPDQDVDLKEKNEEKVPDQDVDLKEKTEEKVPDQEVDPKEKTEEKVPDQDVDLKEKTEEKVPDQEVDLKEKNEEKVPDQDVDLKEKNEEKVPDQEVDLKEKTEEEVPDQEVDLKEKNEEKVPDQDVDLKEKNEEKVPDQDVDLKEKTEEKVPDQDVDLKEKTEEKVPDQDVDLKEKTEEKVPDQDVDLKEKNEEKVPDQDVDLKEKTEEKVPDQDVDLKEKTEEKVPDQDVDLKEKTEEKVPDQEVDLKEKTEEKVPDQEVDLKEKNEEKVPDQDVDLKEKTEEKVPDQEMDLKGKTEEKVPDQDVDLKERTEEKVPDQEVDLKEKTEKNVPDQDVDLKTEETEESLGTEQPQQTMSYIVEYNNGNFVDINESNLDLDLLQNNFGLEYEDTFGNEIGVSIIRPLRPFKDQVLDLSLRLREETYTDALRDPTSLQYKRLERVFTRKMVDAFDRLPGLKNVQVVEFRPQKDLERGLVVSVHYAVTLEVDTGGVSNDTLDFITLQSNFVGKNYARAEQPTVLYTISDFRNYITEALHLQSNENVLLSTKPTTLPTGDLDNMDNILAAEKPPDAPTHESEHQVFLKKEDFQFDTFGFSKHNDELSVSENDVIDIDETATAAVESTTDAITNITTITTITTRASSGRDDAGAAEEEEDSLDSQESDRDLGLRSDFSLDDNLGSGASGDGSVPMSLDSDPGHTNPEVLPPPDLETSEDDLDEIPTSASTKTPHIPPEITGKDEGFEPTEAHAVFEIENLQSEKNEDETPVSTPTLTTEPQEGIKTTQDRDKFEIFSETTVFPVIFDDTTERDETLTSTELSTTGSNDEKANTSITIKPDASNGEIEPTTTATKEDSKAAAEVDSKSPEDHLTQEIVEIPSLIQSFESKRGDSKTDVVSTASVENVEFPSIIPMSEYEAKTETVSSKLPDSDLETKADVSSQTDDNTVRLFSDGSSDSPSFDVSFGLVPFDSDGSGAGPGDEEVAGSIPGVSDSLQARHQRALTVFFSLRVTNMVFNQSLFNKSSDEYRRLEQRFVTLLVPYLESNLNNFQELQILNFQNGSVVVNSRLRFVTPVRRGLTTAVYLVLKDFAASAQKNMDLSIDRSSLDVESGERADACKFLGCNSFSRCRLNPVSLEPECVCLPGHLSVDGLPCLSVCQLQPDFCKNDGKCDVVPGKGAICRCRVGENWFFRGEHCEEFVSETLLVFGAVGSVLCFLFVAVVIVCVLSKFLRQQEPEDDNNAISGDGQKWDQSRFQIPVESDSPVLAQSYRRYDDHLPVPPSYPQAPPPLPTYSGAISRQEMEERLRLQLCSRDHAFNDPIPTTLFLKRRGSSST